ncbi:ABC transporter ATP-binding protein [Xanthomonas hyacinthi DSM 19077]|nr:ABC transporter ATP-binding protein [Xanthomonas hyacinthi DSM 19077]
MFRLPDRPLAFALHFLRRYRRWYLLIVFLEIGAATSSMCAPYAIGGIVKQVSGPAGPLTVGLLQWLGLFATLNLLEAVLARASGACRVHVAPLQRTQATAELYAFLHHHSLRFISSNFAGALANRISETAVGVNMATWTILFEFLPIAIALCVSVLLLAHANTTLAGFALAWSLTFVAVSYMLARRCRTYARSHAEARAETVGKVVDTVSNLSSVRLFARLDFERRNLDQSLAREVKTFRASMGYNEKILRFQFGAAVLLKVGVVAIAVLLWSRGAIGVGEFVMSVSVALLVIAETRNLSRRFLEFFEYIGNIENGVRTIVQPHEITDAPDAATLVVHRARIEFKDVDFAYEDGSWVFRGLNLRIEPGQRVGLVGYSGSGKSTLLNLLLRLYDPQAGQVLLDGVDIATVKQESLHSQIGLIPQDPGLFHRSLLENIRYGRLDASLQEVEHAARVAHAHEFITDMDQHYDALVGERGVKLSGGQRQRIAIARVVLKDAPILVMDEATSSLDSVTEQAIQNSLDTLMPGKTAIVVAHRLSTIAHLDRILVFDRGRIVEDGSHAELLACGGLYQRLWSRQAGGFLATTAAEA